MNRPTWVAWMIVATAGISLTAAMAAPETAAAIVTVKGDQAAWAEIAAAYRRLNGLPG